MWRQITEQKITVCNACGLYYNLHNVSVTTFFNYVYVCELVHEFFFSFFLTFFAPFIHFQEHRPSHLIKKNFIQTRNRKNKKVQGVCDDEQNVDLNNTEYNVH